MGKNSAALCTLAAAVLYFTNAFAVINTDGSKGVVRTISAKTMGKATMNLGAGVNFAQGNDYVKGIADANGLLQDFVVDTHYNEPVVIKDPAKLLSSNIFVAFGLLSSWDVAMSLPFYYDWAGFGELHDGGLGDLEVSTKFTYPPPSKRLFYQSYYLATTIPVGMRHNGLFPRHPYFLADRDTNPAVTFYSSEYPTIKGLMLWTFDVGSVTRKVPLRFHMNVGGVVNATIRDQNNTAVGSIAMEYTPAEFITLFVDMHGESRWSNFATALDPSSDPMLCTPGLRINTPNGMYLFFAGDFSMSSRKSSVRRNWIVDNYAYSTGVIPMFGAQFAFGWEGYLTVQDDDRDGIKNNEDRCPKDAEDIDGYEDADGCPDLDNDGDGVADVKDKCPNEPEDMDGFKDADGCPDPDNDGDGIMDLKDQCPNVAEDFDGFEDRDGCPDMDNDKDGVADSIDKCPNDPEDFDTFQDNDGCADIDNDQDGIPDIRDRCPNEAETFNGFEDKDGCPDSVKKDPDFPRQQILRGVSFRSQNAEMTFDSYQYIDPLIRALKQYPELEIEVRAHTDGLGNFGTNMRLSQMRAEAIRQYIISKDISSDRVRATGMGSTSPIADDKTAAGRTINRRVEIIRTK